MGANESVQRPEKGKRNERAHGFSQFRGGRNACQDMRTNTESEDLETICDQISGDQPETGSCDRHQQCTGRICLDISWETLPALMYRLPNVAAYYTHVNMLGHKEERVSERPLISVETHRKTNQKTRPYGHTAGKISV